MGIYHEYITRGIPPEQMAAERQAQLRRIGELRQSAVIAYAARISPVPVRLPVEVHFEDVLPFSDLLNSLSGDRVSVVIETLGGVGETGRHMVEMLHERFRHVEFIVPGVAMSTGTIMVLGGHEIFMGPESALGPIDAQIFADGKQYSADALIEGFNSIKREVLAAEDRQLNPAYIPILQRISPGEIQAAHNALEFARETVTEWLTKYKFANWNTHRSTGAPVTPAERRARARSISEQLSSQTRWRSHGRAVRLSDLEALRLIVTDYTTEPELGDTIRRYHALLRLWFESTNVFKLFETPTSMITRNFAPPGQGAAAFPQQAAMPSPQGPPGPPQGIQQARSIVLQAECSNCKAVNAIQLDFAPGQPTHPGARRFPNSGTLSCAACQRPLDLAPVRREIERQVGRPALTPQPEA